MADADDLPQPAPGAKMMFLIRRRTGVSREELVAHWFANHMPGVIAAQERAAAAGRRRAFRYLATVFDPPGNGNGTGSGNRTADGPWDGVAQLWFDEPLPRPPAPFGDPPRDAFQAKAEPYSPWATVEYVIVDGSERLPVEPLEFGASFPTTRSGFSKLVYLVVARPDTDYEALFRHWLGVHTGNVAETLEAAGGFRYVVSLSLDPANEPYAGMAELYLPDDAARRRFHERLEPDGIERWLDPGTVVLTAGTEMIGIP